MHQAAEAFSLRPPTQVGGGIDSALGGLAKQVGRTERQDASAVPARPTHIPAAGIRLA